MRHTLHTAHTPRVAYWHGYLVGQQAGSLPHANPAAAAKALRGRPCSAGWQAGYISGYVTAMYPGGPYLAL